MSKTSEIDRDHFSMSVILLNKSLSFFPVPRFCLMEITLASFNE